jgi:hypothetical protein
VGIRGAFDAFRVAGRLHSSHSGVRCARARPRGVIGGFAALWPKKSTPLEQFVPTWPEEV